MHSLKALARTALASGDWRTGLAAALEAARADPLDFRFVQGVLEAIARCPASALPLAPIALPAAPPSLSVVVVSNDDARFAAVEAEYERAFAHWPHERIRIADARSMYDGFARGFAQARGEVIVFSHDDIRFAAGDFAGRLADAIAHSDLVGVAGTTRLGGPAISWSGHPHLFGSVTHKADDEPLHEFSVWSLRAPRIPNAQALDGVFLAARRGLVEHVGFDAERFDGFHFYDLDFSHRAHLAGARVTIAADLGLIHRSRGHYDEKWVAAQRTFARKFGFEGDPPPVARHWHAVRLKDAAAVAAMHAKLASVWNVTFQMTPTAPRLGVE